MNRWLMSMLAASALVSVNAAAEAPAPVETPGQRPPATFPLAAPAGKDSNARQVAPAGAINKGPFDPTKWKNGGAFAAPAGSKIWNPVRLKMQQGKPIVAGTLYHSTDPAIYCAMANAGYDFIWTEMQHSSREWQAVEHMWRTCPHAKAVPGVRVAYTDERREGGALGVREYLDAKFIKTRLS